jgi:superfamily I DNA/RNA helicase
VDAWNSQNPAYRLTGEATADDDGITEAHGATDADTIFNKYNVLRNRMRPRELWPYEVRMFAERWERFKRESDSVDFCDMIEIATRDCEGPPGEASILIADESQDLSAMEWTLLRKWGEKMDKLIVAGDDDQACFYFKGADYTQFLTPIPNEQKTVLSQSYRVPRAVQAVAESWVKTLKRREPKEYKPRDFEGEVRHLKGATFQAPELALKDAERYLSEGKSVMFLTTCSYMLDPLKALLRSEGIPFHNPYRRSRHDWNPLFSESKTSSKERLLAFLRPQGEVWGEDARLWNIDDLRMFMALLKTKDALMPGAKKLIENYSIKERGFVELDINGELIPWLGPGNLYEAMEGNLDWFEYCLLAAKKKPMEYLLRIARQRGGQALRNDPQVVIGTMHSTKGGECDKVYIFPDLSMSAMEEWQGMGEARESIIRLFYVGMTRAKEGLIFCDPSTGLYPTELERLWCKL